MPFLLGILGTFGAWLVERLGKYFISIGAFGLVYMGVDVLIDRFVGQILSSLGTVVSAGYQILMMAGFGEVINVTISAIAFVLAAKATQTVTGD